SHNADVDRINDAKLADISGEACAFAMTAHGKASLVETLKHGCLSPEVLSLKIGARVMFTKNDVERKFVNGTLGVIAGFSKENGFPIVKTNSGRTFSAEPVEWHVEDGGRVLARILQIPLRLAWAITVHKSQGMSLDGAHMDLSQAFEYGQGYVALSRVRTLAGLSLSGLNERALQVHPEVAKRDRDFKLRSASARKAFEAMPKDEHDALKRNFVHACGGMEPEMKTGENKSNKVRAKDVSLDPSKKYSLADIRRQHRNAYRPWSKEDDTELRRRYLSGEKVKTLAETLGRQAGSIRSRLVKFGLVN
ncbi:MAG: AAA family ATPase, partial [Candidatus Kaiserbacteria bacterium]|nr:AAA family ATPase [Candidatus Kaiserbacteria bacterium]